MDKEGVKVDTAREVMPLTSFTGAPLPEFVIITMTSTTLRNVTTLVNDSNTTDIYTTTFYTTHKLIFKILTFLPNAFFGGKSKVLNIGFLFFNLQWKS